MKFKEIAEKFNVISQCKKYGVGLWQCPQFLFLVMGGVIIGSTLLAYLIGNRFIDDPEMVALAVLIITAVLLTISFIITDSFEKLAEVNRMKSEFISIVSHQLRSPLTNLKWVLELLITEKAIPFVEKQLDYLKILKENLGRMDELISDLLIVSRLETAEIILKQGEFPLEELARKTIEEFGSFSTASNVKVNLEVDGGVSKAFADVSQIRLVVENLLSNAIRYINKGGIVEIKISKKNRSVYLEIKDNGLGIPVDDQKYIFQKFFRARNVVHHQTQGSGLGLYIAKTIVEKSGGKIGFKSQENVGSTFWFSLPKK